MRQRGWLWTLVLATLVVLAGCIGTGDPATLGRVGGSEPATLERVWTSDTGTDVRANHHALATDTVGETAMVFTPVGASGDKTGCGLYGLYGANGSVSWLHSLSPENCTIHAVGDPTLADNDGDGETELLATTTGREFIAFDPQTGTPETRFRLTAYGYTQPVVADLRGDATPETVVVDAHGTLSVRRPDGTAVWTRAIESDVFADLGVADFDGDGAPEIAVGTDDGEVLVFAANGDREWAHAVGATVSWTATGQLDEDSAVEFVATTIDGDVVALDGTGSEEWSRTVGPYAAVDVVTDGDDDGTPEVYVTDSEGTIRALDGATGRDEWTTALPDGERQMTPPPTAADLDGDGTTELVVVTNAGTVAVVDADGTVLATGGRDVPVWIGPMVADVTDDPGNEVLVNYGDGRVAAFTYRAE